MYYRRNRIYDNLTVIVRQGDVFSSKQLNDIALKHSRAVVILVNDTAGRVCKFEQRDLEQEKQKGNPQIIKTLMQVADITSSQESDDDQKIIVEISDPWTEKLVEKSFITNRCGANAISYRFASTKCSAAFSPSSA
ncbi:hypothetical protein [Allobaculum sp. Allo2]|uniref:hypothetical protein n=1 Tax=Allobaculum sp. Allo2 TaxID=2853432 RepID=UPI001F61B1A0|nr:hypothetical protein [Allobaculum sp. Allo2]UNT92172.1 hypothetical protein KWG61_07990 [Allobaculum sp. Allo2]